MQKTIILMLTLFVISCTNNNYEKLVDEKFKKSKYEDILEKNIEKKTYYKYDYSKKFKQENIFLFIEKEDTAKLYLGINYRGKDWLYMKSIEFIGAEDFEIDFLDYRTFNPIWKDNTTINMGVEEKILFPVDEKYMVNLEKMLQNEEVNIILKSDYDERISKRKLSVKELVRMRKILDLYKTILQENERKTDGN
ncbi:MAG: hypothetical protein KA277_06440 [Fusobacteriaceae bacterium]|jgi:hypothetical protein|nr:hypothetical protein [Fusobacteriaceae bacterium]MBP9597044.1 hypothetical protein [Fusobacteriaceae bacterium]